MYVCVCNAIRESDIRACVTDKGARTPMEVFRAMGASPQCRMCIPDIRRLVQDVLRETEAVGQACALAHGGPANLTLGGPADLTPCGPPDLDRLAS